LIGLDTNVLVRYIVQDDPIQSPKATALIESLSPDDPAFLSLTLILELIWVLSSLYERDKADLIQIIDSLLRTHVFAVEQTQTLWNALSLYRTAKADFEDCLIQCSGSAAGCDYTLTFDSGAAKTAGMRLIK
jgi:predicted nucleic-acid-binding protein